MSDSPEDKTPLNEKRDSESKSMVDDSNPEIDDDSEKLVLSPPDTSTSLRDVALWAGMFFLLALTVFSPALRGEFLWDDDRHVSENMALRTPEGFAKLWVPNTTPQYYPLTHSLNWVLYHVAARADGTINTLVFHLANVLIHAGSATLLWFILRRLKVPGAWLAAAIFAVHPVQVETVAWISEMKNILSGVFFFGAILLYLRFEDVGTPFKPEKKTDEESTQPRWDLYGYALALFVGALLSKTVTCSMPAVMLILIWWKRGRVTVRDIVRLVPFFAIGVIMAIVTARIEATHVIGGQIASGEWGLSIGERIMVAGNAVWFYFAKLLAPIGLTFIYPKWNVQGWSALHWLFPLAVIAVLAVLFALRKMIGRAPFAAALIYVGMLVPALGFVNVYPMRYSYVADHFQYHAAAAMIALIVGVLGALSHRFFPDLKPEPTSEKSALPAELTPSPAPYVLGGVLVLLLSLIALRHARVFDNSISLWEDTIEKNPRCWMAYNNLSREYYALALAHQDQGNVEEGKKAVEDSIHSAQKAIDIKPDHANAYVNQGRALELTGQVQQAVDDYRLAVKYDKTYADAHYFAGMALIVLGKYNEAVGEFDAAIELVPHPAFYYGKAKALVGLKDYEKAEAAFLASIERSPDDIRVRNDYGMMLAASSKTLEGKAQESRQVEAANQFLFVIRNAPEFIDARINMADLFIRVAKQAEIKAGSPKDKIPEAVGNALGKAQEQLLRAAALDKFNRKLLAVAKEWSDQMTVIEASTRPTTTRSTTGPTTGATTLPTTVPTTEATTSPAPSPATAPAATSL